MLTYYKNSRSIMPTFSKQQVALFLTRDMGRIDDFGYIIFLKSEKNVYSQTGKCFQDALLTVTFIGLSLKRYR